MFQYNKIINNISPDNLQLVLNDGAAYLNEGKVFTNGLMKDLQMLLNISTVGASGAVFGILLAFGVLFPNTELMLLFVPVPIKAKYFVIGYGVIELVLAVTQPGSNIAMLRIWEACCLDIFSSGTGEKQQKHSTDGNQ